MSERDPFGERLRSNRAAQNRALRQQAVTARNRLSREEGRRQEVLQALRDKVHTGTDPHIFFDPHQARLCEEFLAHMKRRRLEKSESLEEVLLPEFSGGRRLLRFLGFREDGGELLWGTKGYQVGRFHRENPVFLCEDGMLRVRTAIEDPRGFNDPRTGRVRSIDQYDAIPVDMDASRLVFGGPRMWTFLVAPMYKPNYGPEGGPTSGYDPTTRDELWFTSVPTLEERLIEIAS